MNWVIKITDEELGKSYEQVMAEFTGDDQFVAKVKKAEEGDLSLRAELERNWGKIFDWNQEGV